MIFHRVQRGFPFSSTFGLGSFGGTLFCFPRYAKKDSTQDRCRSQHDPVFKRRMIFAGFFTGFSQGSIFFHLRFWFFWRHVILLPSICQKGIYPRSMPKLARSCVQEAGDFRMIFHRVPRGFLFLPPSVLVLVVARYFASLNMPSRNRPKIDADASTIL